MRTFRFCQVNVFSADPLGGNPLAVVHDAEGLSDARMAALARWTNLSETTFLLPRQDPKADYRVRIFTPGGELPFAGHPTLGSCHARLRAGGRRRHADRIVQQCGVGLVQLRPDGTRLAFSAPPLRRTQPSPGLLAQVAAALGLKQQNVVAAQQLDNGPVWLSLFVDTPATILALNPDHAQLKALGTKVGLAARYVSPESGGVDLEVRAFA